MDDYADFVAASVDASMRDAAAPDSSIVDAATADGQIRDASGSDACPLNDCGAPALPTFEQEAYIKSSDTQNVAFFGQSVAMDGDTLVVGQQTNSVWPWGGTVSVFVRRGETWVREALLIATSVDAGDLFGQSVAIDGDTLVVGASLEDSSAPGVNGDESDNVARDSGAAYVFVRRGGHWRQQAFLKASNPGAEDYFGTSVAVSGDTVVVGAPYEDANVRGIDGDELNDNAVSSGAAYVFTRNGDIWTQRAYLKASNTGDDDRFGTSVAVSGDTIAVGAHAEGSRAAGIDGDQADDGASASGAVYVFVRSATRWMQQAYVKASNPQVHALFGTSVAMADDTLVVGALGESSGGRGVNSDRMDDSAQESGAAYVFVRRGATWSQQAYLKASNAVAGDGFGSSVAIAGDMVVVGATEQPGSVAGVIGGTSENPAEWSGAAYVFARRAGDWNQAAFLKASNPGATDGFGYSVAIFDGTIAVGAFREGSTATGINGDQTNNDCGYCGAVYVFRVIP